MRLALGKVFLAAALSAAAVVAAATAPTPAWADEPPLSPRLREMWVTLLPPAPAPQTPFATVEKGAEAAAERSLRLADFAGRVVLLNVWATWCAPCVHEMPALDQLQADLRDEGLAVVALSTDRGGLNQVGPFYEDLALDNLEIYLDPRGQLARALDVRGLPTTYLIDAEGRVVGAMQGAYDWAGEDAKALIRHYLDKSPARQAAAE